MEATSGSGPERRIVTVLFADLVGFTSLAERLDPDDLAIVQDAYFAALRDVVARYRGRLEKFIGDAAMAAFGVPRTEDDDAVRAVSAGFAMLHAIGDLGARLGLDTEELRLRVGVNTGEVVVASIGPDEGRLSGDAVNVAARLQAAAEPGTMVVGGITALAVAGAVALEPLPPLALKGKAGLVNASRAVAMRSEPSRELAMGRLRASLRGRAAELSTLSDAAERAMAGAAPRVLILAPPGVGKTRLVEEFGAKLDAQPGWSVLHVRVTSEAAAPFAPIARLVTAALDDAADRTATATDGGGNARGDPIEQLRASLVAAGVSARRADTVTEHARDLLAAPAGSPLGARTSVPTMAAAPDASAPMADAPGRASSTQVPADRASLFLSWLQALDALGSGRTQAWILEDLHWAGRDVFAFLDAALEKPPTIGRLIVATGRPSVLEAGGVETTTWQQLELPTLPVIDARALVDELTGSALSEALVDQIVARSDGNCLFIEELLRGWVGAGILVEAGAAGVRLSVDPDDVPLPPTVQAVYAAQLDDLPSQARLAARRGSVCGRRFPVEVLHALGVDAPADAVAALGRRGIVGEPQPAPLVGDEHSFRHALLRDTGYASLGRAERAELHVRTARWLEDAAGGRADELSAAIGNHYADAVAETPALARQVADRLDRAGAATLAARWLEVAGDRALGLGARAGASELFRRSVDLTGPEDRLDAARRWRRVGEAIVGARDLEDGAVAFARAVELARSALAESGTASVAASPARRELALAAAGLARARYEQIRFAEAVAIAEEALAVVGESMPEAVPLRLARLRGIEGVSNDYAAVHVESERVLAAALATGDATLVFDARRVRLGFATNLGQGTAEAWVDLSREARALGRWSDAVVGLSLAAAITRERDPIAARPLLDEAEALAEARGLSEQMAWIGLARASDALEDGDWDAGVAAGLAGLDLAERYGYDRAAVRTWFALTPMAEVRHDRAILERAAAWAARHRSSFPHSPYGAVMQAAVDLRIADVGLGAEPDLDDETLLAGLGLIDDLPEWLAATERIVQASIAAGRVQLARTLIQRLPAPDPARHACPRSRLADARRRMAGRGGAGGRRRRSGRRTGSRGTRGPATRPRGLCALVGGAIDPAAGRHRRRDPGRARRGG